MIDFLNTEWGLNYTTTPETVKVLGKRCFFKVFDRNAQAKVNEKAFSINDMINLT